MGKKGENGLKVYKRKIRDRMYNLLEDKQ